MIPPTPIIGNRVCALIARTNSVDRARNGRAAQPARFILRAADRRVIQRGVRRDDPGDLFALAGGDDLFEFRVAQVGRDLEQDWFRPMRGFPRASARKSGASASSPCSARKPGVFGELTLSTT